MIIIFIYFKPYIWNFITYTIINNIIRYFQGIIIKFLICILFTSVYYSYSVWVFYCLFNKSILYTSFDRNIFVVIIKFFKRNYIFFQIIFPRKRISSSFCKKSFKTQKHNINQIVIKNPFPYIPINR